MPLFIPTPRNETVLRELGPYPGCLNVLSRKASPVQRTLRDQGLAGYEPDVLAAVLAAVQIARRPVEFFDIGADIGVHAALVAAIFPRDIVHVTGFESGTEQAGVLQRIADWNELPLVLEREVPGAHGPLGERLTLDAYSVERGRRPSVIKLGRVDPVQVLVGAEQVLADAQPTLIVAQWAARDRHETEGVLSRLTALGYTAAHAGGGSGWTECGLNDLKDIHANVILRPDHESRAFLCALSEWRAAIRSCTAEQNFVADPGTRPPAGWGAPHRRLFEVKR